MSSNRFFVKAALITLALGVPLILFSASFHNLRVEHQHQHQHHLYITEVKPPSADEVKRDVVLRARNSRYTVLITKKGSDYRMLVVSKFGLFENVAIKKNDGFEASNSHNYFINEKGILTVKQGSKVVDESELIVLNY
jgi:hypothetical protein